jgi:hypothetical protein
MKAKRIGKCECGGTVYGVRDFGRLFSWCNRCTPVVSVKLPGQPVNRKQGGK